MNRAAGAPKFSRFAKHIVLGSVLGGALACVPVLNYLKFCLPIVLCVVLALWMYLRANPGDRISVGEAAGFGAISGAGAGLIFGVLCPLFFGTATAFRTGRYIDVDGIFASAGIAFGIVFIPLAAVSAAFGALGAALAMQLLFKPRIRRR
jgi:hypothetical protein